MTSLLADARLEAAQPAVVAGLQLLQDTRGFSDGRQQCLQFRPQRLHRQTHAVVVCKVHHGTLPARVDTSLPKAELRVGQHVGVSRCQLVSVGVVSCCVWVGAYTLTVMLGRTALTYACVRSCAHSLTHSHTHRHTHAHTHTRTLKRTQTYMRAHTLKHTLIHTHTDLLIYPPTCTLTMTPIHCDPYTCTQ